jgi:hypothetical protein
MLKTLYPKIYGLQDNETRIVMLCIHFLLLKACKELTVNICEDYQNVLFRIVIKVTIIRVKVFRKISTGLQVKLLKPQTFHGLHFV